MKTIHHIVTVLFLVCIPCTLSGQTSSRDYVISRTLLNTSGTKYQDAVQYYDGVGLPTQLLEKKVTPSGTNRISRKTYDNRGRQIREYLPLEQASSVLYVFSGYYGKDTACYHDSRPYSLVSYEATPSGRVATEAGPGDGWAGHSVAHSYGSNTSSGMLSCKRYVVLSGGGLASDGTQPAGTLHTETVTDEDGTVTILFRDFLGRTVLSRVINGSQYLSTYTVYDGHGNVRYVLQPMYQETADTSKYAFIYKYDVLDRVVREKKPGCAAVRYWYDKGGHLTFSQDGSQAAAGQWTFHLYDNRHREVLRGVCPKTSADANVLSSSVVTVTYSSSGGLCSSGYATAQLSLTGAALQEATYYDSYAFLSRTGFTDRTVFPAADASVSANGLVTGTLKGVTGSSTRIRTASYYDAKGRTVKTVTTNLSGGHDTETVTYSFTDKPATRTVTHAMPGATTLTEEYAYTYDNADRLSSVTHKVGGGSTKTILANTYDFRDRILTESFEGNSASKRTYTYDIRSQVTRIFAGTDGALFKEYVKYNTWGGTHRFGGAPSAVFWKVKGESSQRGYFLTYDGAGRLTEATYGESTSLASNTGRYTEKVTGYDRNGNMTGFRRYGKTSSGGFGLLDDLTYTLEGNRMVAVSDAVSTAALTGNTTFTDGTSSGTEYTYDADGRMTSDLNRGLTAMTYNVMGLLSGVTKSSGASATWNYDGSGRKVRRAVTSSGGTMVTTDYIGNAVYTDGVLALLRIPNGYVTMSGTTPSYHYYQKDHLGSNRMVTTAGGTVQQISHFYPFGGVFGESSGATLQRFKFTDKEQDFSILPGWYDFGARYYDPVLCQWTGPDPLSGKYPAWSPYAYCGNSPYQFVDPNGRDWYSISLASGQEEILYDEKITRNNFAQSGIQGKYLGETYLDKNTNTYYSLFGEKVLYRNIQGELTAEGQLYQKIDRLLMLNIVYQKSLSLYDLDTYTTEVPNEPRVELFSGPQSGELHFSYNGQIEGVHFSSITKGTIYYYVTSKENSYAFLRRLPEKEIELNGIVNKGTRWRGYFLLLSNGKRSNNVQIQYDQQNAGLFMKAYNNLLTR